MARTRVAADSPLFVVRRSAVHGRGVFALRAIAKGTRVVEYLGERITHAEADSRYEDHEESDNHTFLFSVDRGLVIDAGIDGNDARFINHSCDPNCESVIERRRVFIDAIRDIAPGEELSYDYQIGRERGDPPNVDEIYACRCGSARCRGTMLWPPRRTAVKAKRRKRPAAQAAPAKRRRRTAAGGAGGQGAGAAGARRATRKRGSARSARTARR
ncbi:MAG TPA: SET domain-containing protein-lysine N-methyltransferase [Steroidobacteraceae bacterium]|nr:SET domain-containing protein-lysine N-methyltransferase [Steroidobacteraceae bacterium]